MALTARTTLRDAVVSRTGQLLSGLSDGRQSHPDQSCVSANHADLSLQGSGHAEGRRALSDQAFEAFVLFLRPWAFEQTQSP